MMRLQRGSNNTPVKLGRELGRGGEGTVYPVVSAPDLVAKIYLKPPAATKIEKLRSMSRHATPALLRVAAWPVDVLSDESGAVRGFLMPKVSAREDVHQLYSPRSRRRTFPTVDFRFVVRVATNIARAFAQVHSVGHVVGDVNHGNALVGRDGTVVLIDCDSFQIRAGSRQFTCDVGVPLFTPPELAGHAFRGLKRSANHDAFGLAVLLFHLMYLGRHPYAGKYAAGEMPIERAIAESRFVYGVNAATFGMSRPPGTLPLETFGDPIAQLFERAFAPPGEAARPTAAQWVEALQAFEAQLVGCSATRSHYFPPGPGGCCWCGLELQTGLKLFGGKEDTFDAFGTAKLAPLWDAIGAVSRPKAVQRLDVPPVTDIETKSQDPLGPLPRIILSWALVFMAGVALLVQPGEHFALATLTFGAAIALRWGHRKFTWRSERAQAIYRTMFVARKHLANVIHEWNDLCVDNRFDELLTRLTVAKEQVLELAVRRESSVKSLTQVVMNQQRNRYLEQFRIDKAKLPNVTEREILALKHYDVDTADDIFRPGVYLTTMVSFEAGQAITAWAKACARNFQFDPAHGVDPTDVQTIETELRQQQEKLLARLQKGREELEQLTLDLAARRDAKKRELDDAHKALTVASNVIKERA